MTDDAARRFSDAVRPVAEALGAFAQHANRLTGHAGPPPPGSVAASELGVEDQLAEDMWTQPVRWAHYEAAVLAYFVLDHVDAIAALLPNAILGPAYAHWALLRSVIDVGPAAAWINDPAIAADVRIRRSITLERQSLGQFVRLPGNPVTSNAQRRQKQLNDYERARRWTRRDREEAPHARSVESGEYGAAFTPELWQIASAKMHADLWALVTSVREHASEYPSGRPIAGVAVDARECIQVAALVAVGAAPVVDARMQFVGCTPDQAYMEAWDHLTAVIAPLFEAEAGRIRDLHVPGTSDN